MTRKQFSYTHGDTGLKPPRALNFEDGGRPRSEYFDWWWTTVINAIEGHADEFDRLDSDDDGNVDNADAALTWKENSTQVLQYAKILNVTDNLSLSSSGNSVELSVPDSEIEDTIDGSSVSITGTASQTETNANNYTDSEISSVVDNREYRINPYTLSKYYDTDEGFSYQTVETYTPNEPVAISEIYIYGEDNQSTFEGTYTPIDWGDKLIQSVEFRASVNPSGNTDYLNRVGFRLNFKDGGTFSIKKEISNTFYDNEDHDLEWRLMEHYITQS